MHVASVFIWNIFLCNTRIFEAIDKLFSLHFNWLLFLLMVLLLLLLLSSYIWFFSVHFCSIFTNILLLLLNHFFVGNSLHHSFFLAFTLSISIPVAVVAFFIQAKKGLTVPVAADAAFTITVCAESLLLHVHWHR